ncbi:MarR family winged helix-turn-helix transcriptional regulator [Jiella sp. M17.18]|uniref:MarR family winged helix-turn-helix transcriptional regulator n=1 Tax=Jiella sp. M17.18 TaxID=3234247 RepID=UPI0034DFD7CA
MVDRGTSSESVAELAERLRSLISRLKRRLREQANAGDLTPSQVAVLVRLERDGPATVSALARMEGVRPQSMGSTVAALQAAGLVEGAPDPADGRQTILTLTDACRRMVVANRATRKDWLVRRIEAALTDAEQKDLARAVALLERLADTS